MSFDQLAEYGLSFFFLLACFLPLQTGRGREERKNGSLCDPMPPALIIQTNTQNKKQKTKNKKQNTHAGLHKKGSVRRNT